MLHVFLKTVFTNTLSTMYKFKANIIYNKLIFSYYERVSKSMQYYIEIEYKINTRYQCIGKNHCVLKTKLKLRCYWS